MYSKFSTSSYIMGMSNNSDILFLSEKDLESMEFNFLVRPTLEFSDESHVAHSEESHDQAHDEDHQEAVQKQVQEEEEREDNEAIREEKEEREEENSGTVIMSSLEIKVPSTGEFKSDEEEEKEEEEDEEEEEEDGFRTPTSLDQRIPLILTCPPAPRKPKTLPSTKRKAPHHHGRLLLDLSTEIQSFFSPEILSDSGNKIKKAKESHCT